MSAIKTPLMVLHAIDDPMINVDGLPMEKLKANSEYISVVLTKTGGHLGYAPAGNEKYGGIGWLCKPSRADHMCLRFLERHIEVDKKMNRAPRSRL